MFTLQYNHPGEILDKEFLEPLNISKSELSKATFLPRTRVDEILKGNAKINADVALRLSKLFGNSAKYWLWLQVEFDIENEVQKDKADLSQIKSIDKIIAA